MDTLPTESSSSKTESTTKEDGISISIPIETPKCLECERLKSFFFGMMKGLEETSSKRYKKLEEIRYLITERQPLDSSELERQLLKILNSQ